MCNYYDSSPILTNCTFHENVADSAGGALLNYDNGNPAFMNCRFLGNYADYGGAVCSFIDVFPTFVQCVFSGNTATNDVGAVYSWDGGNTTLTNCSFSANIASGISGGLVAQEGAVLTLTNCVLWQNIDQYGTVERSQVYLDLGFAVLNYCCVQGWTGQLGGIGNIGTPPVFVDPDGPDGMVGTTDDDLRLSAPSSCVDAGDNDADTDANLAGVQPLPDTDLDGSPRFVDGDADDEVFVDIGAYEYQADCNNNGVFDGDDLAMGTSIDLNTNGFPDECEPDCNSNSLPDDMDLAAGTSADCNANEVPDECDVAGEFSEDCNSNGTPDECESAALIASAPSDQTVCHGRDAVFEVEVDPGFPEPAFQWYLEYVLIPGATEDILVIPGIDEDDAGRYTCIVTWGCIEAESAPAMLTLDYPPLDGALSNRSACEGGATTFTANFTGTVDAYQWYRVGSPEPLTDGGNISGSATDKLAFDPLYSSDAGSYYCVGSNGCGPGATNDATLTVMPLPEIIEQPQNVCADAGATAVLHVETGAGIVQYVWLEWDEGSEQWGLPSVGNESGNYTDTLTISPVQAANEGEYMLWLKTSYPCEGFSDTVYLRVGDCCPNAVLGDMDGDDDVDLHDFSQFQTCFGPGMGLEPGCECANTNFRDDDVDLEDYTLWEDACAGPVGTAD